MENFNKFLKQRKREASKKDSPDSVATAWHSMRADDCIQLASCGAHENLPTVPSLPADLFTSCLTTPIETSLRWAYASGRKHLLTRLTPEMIEHTPGQLNDRRTMLGQLNWIFTAITDTIAWNTLPRELFHKLFRNDLLVAALFRNFLLADRIMRSYSCTPVSCPGLPPTHNHPLWSAWDLASDMCLAQLPDILAGTTDFEQSPFFSDQLTAFEVWLSMQTDDGLQEPPEQLPIVLQVLLSQQHRLRALQLLERFLSLGSWAIRKALSVGIFPYVFKLLGSPSPSLRPVLISLWAKILSEDPKCKVDLLKVAASPVRKLSGGASSWKAFMYFVTTVADVQFEPKLRARAAYVLAIFADDHPKGQQACTAAMVIEHIIPQLQAASQNPVEEHEALRVWLCMALAAIWVGNPDGRTIGFENSAVEALVQLLRDPAPRVRAVAVYALGQLIGVSNYALPDIAMALSNYERYHSLHEGTATISQVASTAAGVQGWAKESDTSASLIVDHDSQKPSNRMWTLLGKGIGLELLGCLDDGSHAVRLELAYALTSLVAWFKDDFAKAAKRSEVKEGRADSIYADMRKILKAHYILASDPVLAVRVPALYSLQSINCQPKIPWRSEQQEIITRIAGSPGAMGSVAGSLVPGGDDAAKSASMAIPVVSDTLLASTLKGSIDPAQSFISSMAVGSGSFVWRKSGLRIVKDGEMAPVEPTRTMIEEIVMKISQVAAQEGSDNSQLQDALSTLYHDIVLAADSSSAVEAELHRMGWSAVDYVEADLARYVELGNRLQLGTESSPDYRRNTTLMPWYCEVLESCTSENSVQERNVNDFNMREWRLEVYSQRRKESVAYADAVESEGLKLKLSDTIFHTPTREVPSFMLFHPREHYLVLANKKSGRLCVWNTTDLKETCAWENASPRTASEISSIQLINEHDRPLLAVGTQNGFVRLWSDWESEAPVLRTGWRALHRMRESDGRRAGLILGWNQSCGRLYAGGDVPYIQIWDANTESRYQKISSNDKYCVTSMCVSSDNSGIIGAGFADGSVCLFDPRLPNDQSLVQKYEQHTNWVVNVHLQRMSQNHIISGSEGGDILWWDPRFPGQAVRNLIVSPIVQGSFPSPSFYSAHLHLTNTLLVY